MVLHSKTHFLPIIILWVGSCPNSKLFKNINWNCLNEDGNSDCYEFLKSKCWERECSCISGIVQTFSLLNVWTDIFRLIFNSRYLDWYLSSWDSLPMKKKIAIPHPDLYSRKLGVLYTNKNNRNIFLDCVCCIQ